MMKPIYKNIGDSFDDFLKEEGIFNEVETTVWKRTIALQIEQEMKAQNLTKTELARRIRKSRSALDRILDPDNTSVPLDTLNAVISALGKKLRIEVI